MGCGPRQEEGREEKEMTSRCNRLGWILDKLSDGPRKISSFDLPVSQERLFQDAILLEKLGYIQIQLGRVDGENILTLLKNPLPNHLEMAYLLYKRQKSQESRRDWARVEGREAVLV